MNEELDKIKKVSDAVVNDYHYMYSYNVELVYNMSDTNKYVSSLNKKITDLEIEEQKLKDELYSLKGLVAIMGCTILVLLGGLVVCLL